METSPRRGTILVILAASFPLNPCPVGRFSPACARQKRLTVADVQQMLLLRVFLSNMAKNEQPPYQKRTVQPRRWSVNS